MKYILVMLIALLVTAPAAAHGTRWVISVGVGKYEHPSFRELRGAEKDAQAVAEAFSKDFPHRVEVIAMNEQAGRTQAALRPTADNVRKQLERLRALIEPDDQVIVYLAGHGCESPRHGAIFFPADTDPNKPSSMLAVTELLARLRVLKARQKMLIIDACREHRQITVKPQMPELPPEDSMSRPMIHEGTTATIYLHACSSGQYAYECPNSKLGILTCQLLAGLKNGADKDGDGIVTAAELLEEVKLSVRKTSKASFKEEQMPQVVDDSNGSWSLARCTAAKAEKPRTSSTTSSYQFYNFGEQEAKKQPREEKRSAAALITPGSTWVGTADYLGCKLEINEVRDGKFSGKLYWFKGDRLCMTVRTRGKITGTDGVSFAWDKDDIEFGSGCLPAVHTGTIYLGAVDEMRGRWTFLSGKKSGSWNLTLLY